MSNQKSGLEINISKLERSIDILKKDMEQYPERNADIKKEQAKLLQLFYKLRQVTFLKSKSLLITVLVNFIIINVITLAASSIKGPIDLNLMAIATLFVCLILANFFLLKAIRAWADTQTIKINNQIEDSKATLLVLAD